MTVKHTRILLFCLFVASGFTGLIYESIWSHYLKLFLGHAAYAQALVLAIFMGGMAIGAGITAKHSSKWSNLLLIYAAVEALIGLLAIGFHPSFENILSISFDQIIPSLNSPTAVYAYKWSIAGLLILPQSILLGMTFPLMSNGLIRLLPGTQGATLSMLYFCNSIGAAIGVLVSGFYLIELMGLPGTILTAGLFNIVLAIIVYGIAKKHKPEATNNNQTTSSTSKLPIFFLAAAFITGVASFIYELVWIRMLSMVLGASTHSFELMLSAFITGLAFGGLFIYKRIDNFKSPILIAGCIQILMGLFALATIPLYNFTFDFMSFIIQALDKTLQGYQLFSFSSHLIALLVMLPTTFCAGMTLPLFTFILLKQGYGEKSVGYTYACNTFGAIVGVIFTIYIGLPILGLKNSLLLGTSLDIILGACLIIFLSPTPRFRTLAIPSLLIVISISSIMLWSNFDQRRMSSGVFRTGQVSLGDDKQVLFHKDGKTASISVAKFGDIVAIMTNGKPDAAINMDLSNPERERTPDEITMLLAGLIPLSIYPEAEMIANIGMGSGLTTNAILSSPIVKQVDTIEIEPAIIEGANFFRPRVERAYSDTRSHFYIEDAKTFFSTHNKKYDLIISEPSNPWVSGVSSLFSEEFYERITHHLEDEGMLVQWLHLYELNTPLIFSVLKALSSHFSDFALYSTGKSDMVIIARNDGAVRLPTEKIFKHTAVLEELTSVNLNSVHDIHARFIGNNETLLPLINAYDVSTNSDYFPYLDLNAPRARFLGTRGTHFRDIKEAALPVTQLLLPRYNLMDPEKVSEENSYPFSGQVNAAIKLVDYIEKKPVITEDLTAFGIAHLDFLMRLADSCEAHIYPKKWVNNFYPLMAITVPYLREKQLTTILNAITPSCDDEISEQQIMLLNLYKSFASLNIEEIIKYSKVLFDGSGELPSSHKQFLFSTQMLGLIASNNPQAQSFWNENIEHSYGEDLVPMWLNMLYTISQTQ